MPSRQRSGGRSALAYSLLFLALCVAWRVDYAPLLGLRSLSPAAVAASVAGALWIDVLLALVVVGALVAAGRRKGAVRVAGLAAAVALFAWVATARIMDRGYFFYSGSHVDRIALEHLQGNAFDMRLDARVLGYLLVAVPAAAAALALLCLAARAARVALLRVAAPLAGVAAAGFLAGLLAPADDAGARLTELQAAPEVAIPLLALRRSLEHDATIAEGAAEKTLLLHPVVKRKLRRFGIEVDESRAYPLVRDHVFRKPLPHPRTARATAKPNVIVLFFESFSAALTSVYPEARKRFPGLTPNLEELARDACVVEDFFNASTPTVTSLACCYGSYLPVTNTQTWYAPENNHGNTRLHCLPHILRARGWHTTHVHSLTNDFVRTGEAVSRLGFEHVVDGPAIGAVIGERQAHWGFSDHQIFRYVTQVLREGRLPQPFLLSVATVDSHAPFLPSKECAPYGDGSNPLLGSLHSADHAFGAFWRWFRESEYAANTIVVATADHAMFPGKEHLELRADEDLAGRYYDRVLFVLRDPGHELPPRMRLVSSQLDLAPTLLHLLGIDERNHFEGHSLFDDRARYPGVLGMHEFLFGVFQPIAGAPALWCFHRDDVEGACAGARFDPAVEELTRCEYLHYYRWKRWLHVRNRVWP